MWCTTGIYSWSSFIHYLLNDLPLVCKKLDVILFADVANLTAVGMEVIEVEQN